MGKKNNPGCKCCCGCSFAKTCNCSIAAVAISGLTTYSATLSGESWTVDMTPLNGTWLMELCTSGMFIDFGRKISPTGNRYSFARIWKAVRTVSGVTYLNVAIELFLGLYPFDANGHLSGIRSTYGEYYEKAIGQGCPDGNSATADPTENLMPPFDIVLGGSATNITLGATIVVSCAESGCSKRRRRTRNDNLRRTRNDLIRRAR